MVAGNPTMGSSLDLAIVSSVIYRARWTAHSSFCSSRMEPTGDDSLVVGDDATTSRRRSALNPDRDDHRDRDIPMVAAHLQAGCVEPPALDPEAVERCLWVAPVLIPTSISISRSAPKAIMSRGNVGVGGLLHQRAKVHHLVGHQRFLGCVCESQPEPAGEPPMTAASRSLATAQSERAALAACFVRATSSTGTTSRHTTGRDRSSGISGSEQPRPSGRQNRWAQRSPAARAGRGRRRVSSGGILLDKLRNTCHHILLGRIQPRARQPASRGEGGVDRGEDGNGLRRLPYSLDGKV